VKVKTCRVHVLDCLSLVELGQNSAHLVEHVRPESAPVIPVEEPLTL
jgi:hypothetical protein